MKLGRHTCQTCSHTHTHTATCALHEECGLYCMWNHLYIEKVHPPSVQRPFTLIIVTRSYSSTLVLFTRAKPPLLCEQCVSCWVHLLLPPVPWMGVINHRRGLLLLWNCIHSGSIPATHCSLHLEFLPWGYMNRRKEAVNERAEEEEKTFPPQKPFFFFITAATADHRWVSWPRMKKPSVGFDPLWGLTGVCFVSLSEPSCAGAGRN